VWDLNENLSGGGGAVKVIWRVHIDQPALTSINVFSDTLFLVMGNGADNNHLLALDRDNGAVRWTTQKSTGNGPRYPTIGDQLVYLADSNITAYDVMNGEQVWVNNDTQNIIAGPTYGSPGVSGLAELYIVAGDNRIYDLDANTGVELWNIDNGERATELALNADSLFVAGDNYIKAINRQDQSLRWRTPIQGGPVMGGPLVDNHRVLIVTKAGNIYLLDSQSGAAIVVPSIPAPAAGGPAVSGPYIFIPGSDGRLYELLTKQ
jgi:outer membrane protein assembly factor BamB